MKVLTAEAMARVDRRAIDEIGIPSMVLMENAAIGVVDALGEAAPEATSAAIFCGPGNNGGDGLAIGRHLAARGYEVLVVLATEGRALRGDAARQLEICRRCELPVWELAEGEDPGPALEAAGALDVVIDALFGTGLGRPLEGFYGSLVTAINRLPGLRLAVDLPSGLAGGSTQVPGPCVRAGVTVTFAAPKVAHVFSPAADAAGTVVVADLGIPPHLLAEADGELELLSPEQVGSWLPQRRPDGHKGTYGHALVVAGAPGTSGAAVLSTRSAVRGGAGLVTAAVPGSIRDLVAQGCSEAMTVALPERLEGGLGLAALPMLAEAARGKSVVAVGPGLGGAEETREAIRRFVLECPLPLILDADGLNAFAGRLAALRGRQAATILTPHPGEAGRLLATSAADVQADRPGAARKLAEGAAAVALLKGDRSLIAVPGGPTWICPTGNPGMATGGSGDVLTGIIAALRSQGLGAEAATAGGAYLHGFAGDRVADRRGQAGLAAGDLVDELPPARRELTDL